MQTDIINLTPVGQNLSNYTPTHEIFSKMNALIASISQTTFGDAVRLMEETARNLDHVTTGRVFSLRIKEPFQGDHLWKALLVKGRTGLHVPGIQTCDLAKKIDLGYVRVVNNEGEEKVLIDDKSKTLLFQDSLPSEFLAINRMVVENGQQYFEAVYVKSIKDGDISIAKEEFRKKMVNVCIPKLLQDKSKVEDLYSDLYHGTDILK